MEDGNSLDINLEEKLIVAVLDACVLVGAYHRNLLLSLAKGGLYVPLFSNKILDEVEKTISEILNPNVGKHQRLIISEAFPDTIVSGYEWREQSIILPDEGDNHIMALGVNSFADIIVTNNLKDFPTDYLESFQLTAQSCDKFLSDIISTSELKAFHAIEVMRARLTKPSYSFNELIKFTEKRELPKTATKMRKLKKFF